MENLIKSANISNNATCDNSPQSLNEKEKKSLTKLSKFPEEQQLLYSLGNLKTSAVISFISEILQDLIEENSYRKNKVQKNNFFMKNPPNMSFLNFMKRLVKYLKPENSTLINTLIYIDRLLSSSNSIRNKEFKESLFLTENNVYKIFLTSLVCAMKFNEDYCDSNIFFAKVGGLSTFELNLLERDFLNLMDYRLFIDDALFKIYEENFNPQENNLSGFLEQ